jgi:hypothetical protein
MWMFAWKQFDVFVLTNFNFNNYFSVNGIFCWRASSYFYFIACSTRRYGKLCDECKRSAHFKEVISLLSEELAVALILFLQHLQCRFVSFEIFWCTNYNVSLHEYFHTIQFAYFLFSKLVIIAGFVEKKYEMIMNSFRDISLQCISSHCCSPQDQKKPLTGQFVRGDSPLDSAPYKVNRVAPGRYTSTTNITSVTSVSRNSNCKWLEILFIAKTMVHFDEHLTS